MCSKERENERCSKLGKKLLIFILYLHFRYHGDSSSRSRAYRHKPQLTIALEGRRDFSPEKRESFLAYTPRAIASARPRARVHPTHVDIGLSRQAQTQVITRRTDNSRFNRKTLFFI